MLLLLNIENPTENACDSAAAAAAAAAAASSVRPSVCPSVLCGVMMRNGNGPNKEKGKERKRNGCNILDYESARFVKKKVQQ